MAPLASACSKPIVEQMKRLKMGIDNHQQVPSHQQTGNAPPAGSLSHASGVPAPSRRELWAAAFPHGLVLWGSACCESLSHASGVPAPFNKGALGAVPIPGGSGK